MRGRLIFPYGFDERDKFEAPARGCFGPVLVEMEDGSKYMISFYDPTRLAQDVASIDKGGGICFAEPGLVVLSEVTEENMKAAVEALERGGYFKFLMPLDDSDIKKIFPDSRL